jgi:hypothetical protein
MTALEAFGYFLTGLTLVSVGVWAVVLCVVLKGALTRGHVYK